MYGVLGVSEIVNLCDFVFKLIIQKLKSLIYSNGRSTLII